MPLGATPHKKGLTARVYLWPVVERLSDFSPRMASANIRGEVTNEETGKREKFNDPGKLLSILGQWNADKFKQAKKAKKGGV